MSFGHESVLGTVMILSRIICNNTLGFPRLRVRAIGFTRLGLERLECSVSVAFD